MQVLGSIQAGLSDLSRPRALQLSENMRAASILETKAVDFSVTGT